MNFERYFRSLKNNNNPPIFRHGKEKSVVRLQPPILVIYLPHPIHTTESLLAIARSVYISFLYNVNKRNEFHPVKSDMNISNAEDVFRLARNFSR